MILSGLPVFAALLGTTCACLGGEDDLATYGAAARRAGRDAEAHVRLALWCEARGLDAERNTELSEALHLNPHDACARGISGQIRQGVSWVSLKEFARMEDSARVRNRYALYDRKRDEAGDSVQGDLQLASWCAHEGMFTEERAHLTAVVRRDPAHAEAWRLLGYHFREGAWVNPAEQQTLRHQHSRAKEAYHHYRAELKQLVHELAIPEERARAEASLRRIKDPLAVPAIWEVLVSQSHQIHDVAARLLGQIQGPEATSRLAMLAMQDPDAPVRDLAIEALASRDPREYIGPVISYVRTTPKLQIKPIGGPGDPGRIEVEGMEPREYLIPTMTEFRLGTGNPPEPIDTSWLSTMPRHVLGEMDRPGYRYTVNLPDPAVQQAFAQLLAHPSEAAPIIKGLGALAAGKHTGQTPLSYQVYVPPKEVHYRGYPGVAARQLATRIRNSEIELRNMYSLYSAEIKKAFNRDSKAAREQVALLERTSNNALRLLTLLTDQKLGIDPAAWSAWWAGWNRTEPAIGAEAPGGGLVAGAVPVSTHPNFTGPASAPVRSSGLPEAVDRLNRCGQETSS